MSFKSKATKEAEQRIKDKSKKENKDMNKFSKFKTPLTVIATLLTVAAFAVTFFAGTQYQERQHEVIKTEASALVSQLKSQEQ